MRGGALLGTRNLLGSVAPLVRAESWGALVTLEDHECSQGLQAAGWMIVLRARWVWISNALDSSSKKKAALVRSGSIAKAGRHLLF